MHFLHSSHLTARYATFVPCPFDAHQQIRSLEQLPMRRSWDREVDLRTEIRNGTDERGSWKRCHHFMSGGAERESAIGARRAASSRACCGRKK